MANLISKLELEGMRTDLNLIVGKTPKNDLAKTTCTIYRQTVGVLDPNTAKYSTTSTTIYSGPCSISPIIYRRDRTETAGGEAVKLRNYRVLIPFDESDIRIHDMLTVDTSADTNMQNKTFHIVDVIYDSENAARRLTVQDTEDV